jgi:hypothetical protein
MLVYNYIVLQDTSSTDSKDLQQEYFLSYFSKLKFQ